MFLVHRGDTGHEARSEELWQGLDGSLRAGQGEQARVAVVGNRFCLKTIIVFWQALPARRIDGRDRISVGIDASRQIDPLIERDAGLVCGRAQATSMFKH